GVHRVLGHDPVRGVLAPGDHDEPGDRVGHDVLAGQLGGLVGLPGQQRAQPRVDALDVVPGERYGEHGVDVIEDVVDVGTGGRRVRLVQRPLGVGGADDPVPSPRDDEQYGLLRAQDDPGVGVDAVPRHHQVDALGGADVD